MLGRDAVKMGRDGKQVAEAGQQRLIRSLTVVSMFVAVHATGGTGRKTRRESK